MHDIKLAPFKMKMNENMKAHLKVCASKMHLSLLCFPFGGGGSVIVDSCLLLLALCI